MGDGDFPKRSYRSPRREQQALATRLAILDAAQALFERDGYVATTIEAIAQEAAVSAKTVYLAFATKATLLRTVWDRALKGDTSDAPVAQREWYRAIVEEPDPRRQITLLAAGACAMKQRIGPMLRAIRSAAVVDADGAALWELIQTDFYANQREIVSAIAQHKGLRSNLDVSTATDILWTLNHPDVWLLLTGERGWSPAAFETWFRDTLTEQLLGTADSASGAPSKHG
ncbi:MAG TPA: helix-turn-helix domain-containing protein [Egibacteraceae bacterium]|nr:helix-turn-helix domain-containing protein [Egibacteraceae bacterium]